MQKTKKLSKKKTHKPSIIKPLKSGDLPATIRLLDLAKQELKSEITTLKLETKAEFTSVRSEIATLRTETKAEFVSVRTEIASLRSETKAEFAKVNSRIAESELQTKAGFAEVNTKLTKMMALMEEQNARNKVVLDGYTQIYDKVDGIDHRLEKVETAAFGAKQK